MIWFDLFNNEFIELIEEETNRLLESNLSKQDIQLKFKKTYKNRYYLFSKKSLPSNNSHTISDTISDITCVSDND